MVTKEETFAPDGSIEVIPHSDAHVFDLKDVRQRVDAIHRIMAKLMKKDVHYGVIPGTKKPTLYKPGSEILLLTFRVAVEPEITDLSTPDEIRYRIRAFGRHVPTDSFMGAGVGECSSKEEKFLWREALSKEEYEDTPEDQKRIKYKKGWDNGRRYTAKVEQIKVPPADAANAVLKRAKKRAQVDFCLTAMAASEIFTQDVEDLPDGYLNEHEREGEGRSAGPTISVAQIEALRKNYDQLNEHWRAKIDNYLKVNLKTERMEDLAPGNYEKAERAIAKAFRNQADGETETKPDTLSDAQILNIQALIEEIGGTCKAEFLAAHKIKKIGDLPASDYQSAIAELTEKRRGI